MDLLLADFTTQEFAPHVHDSLVVAVTELGGLEFKNRGRKNIAGSQSLVVFNPSEPHSGRICSSGRWKYRSIYLPEQGCKEVRGILGIDELPYLPSSRVRDPELIARFLAVHSFMEREPETLQSHREMLVQVFGELLQKHGDAGRRIPAAPDGTFPVAPVIELLRDCYTTNLTLEQMGAVSGLTPFQLLVAFKRRIGLTPYAYLTQLRLRAPCVTCRPARASLKRPSSPASTIRAH